MMSTTLPRFKSENGLAYVKCGQGVAVVLVHGVGLRAEAWINQIEPLQWVCTVYAVDMPGHGESDLLDDPGAGLSDYVDVIAGFIEHEVKSPVVVVGHSMGAMIALQLAARYAGLCCGAVALNAVYRRTEQARIAVQQRAQAMLENPGLDKVTVPILRWFGEDPEGRDQEMAELCRRWLSDAPASGYARAYRIFSHNDGPSASELKAMQVPACFIAGEMDANSSPSMSAQMAALTPQGSCHVIMQSRHMTPLTHAEQVNPLLLAFIEKCHAKSAGS